MFRLHVCNFESFPLVRVLNIRDEKYAMDNAVEFMKTGESVAYVELYDEDKLKATLNRDYLWVEAHEDEHGDPRYNMCYCNKCAQWRLEND